MCPALLTTILRDTNTHITEHLSKEPEGSMQECHCTDKQTDNMDARPVTDSNSLAPYETLCSVCGVCLIPVISVFTVTAVEKEPEVQVQEEVKGKY